MRPQPVQPDGYLAAQDFPNEPHVLHQWSERLAAVDMWPDAARLLLAAITPASSPEERLHASWVCVRGNRPHDAYRLISPLPHVPGNAAILRTAIDVLCDQPGAYDAFKNVVTDVPWAPHTLRLAALTAVHSNDWAAATTAARRILTVSPQDADMLLIVAADHAAAAEWTQALFCAEKARADRFSCQPDVATDLIALTLNRLDRNAAAHLAAFGHINTGKDGWHAALSQFRHDTTLTADTAHLVRAALKVPSGTAPSSPTGLPAPLQALTGLAGTLTHQTGRLARATARRVPGGTSTLAWLSRTTDLTGHAARASLRVHTETVVHDPARCSCWEANWFSGSEARDYVERHLEVVTGSDDLGLTVRRCPTLNKTWLDIPASRFTVMIDAHPVVAEPDAVRAVTEAEPSYGFYL